MKIFISYIIFILAIVYITYTINFELLLNNILSYSIESIIYLFALNLLSLFLMSARFVLLFNKISILESFKIIAISMGINQIAPVKGGDFLRPFMVKKIVKTKLSYLFAIITIERFLDILILFLLSFYIFPIIDNAIIFMLIFIFSLFFLLRKNNITKVIKLIKLIKYIKVRNFLVRFYITLIKFNKNSLVSASILTVFMYVIYLVAMFLFISYFTTFDLSFMNTAVVFVITTFGFLIPSAPASIGTYEASVVFGLGLYNINKEDALSFALIYHFMQIGTILTIAGFFILRKNN